MNREHFIFREARPSQWFEISFPHPNPRPKGEGADRGAFWNSNALRHADRLWAILPRPLVRRLLVGCCLVVMSSGCGSSAGPGTTAPEPAVVFKPQEMADAIHAVVAADRRAYAIHVVNRLVSLDNTTPVENASQSDALPLPSHMLRLSAQEVQKEGADFHYLLRSLAPLNPKNSPETATEKLGLEFVLSHPGSNYYSEEFLGGRRYFTAVYPDVAFSQTCTDCHNRQVQSARRTYKPGDVIGGMVVRVPLEF